jgi:hypothetical protein
MSRALLVNQSEEAVTKACARFDVEISVLETLDSGGVRLVCVSSEGAALMRRKLRAKLIDGPVVRSRIFGRAGQTSAPVLIQSAGPAHRA